MGLYDIDRRMLRMHMPDKAEGVLARQIKFRKSLYDRANACRKLQKHTWIDVFDVLLKVYIEACRPRSPKSQKNPE